MIVKLLVKLLDDSKTASNSTVGSKTASNSADSKIAR